MAVAVILYLRTVRQTRRGERELILGVCITRVDVEAQRLIHDGYLVADGG